MATEREVEQSLKNLQIDVTDLDVRLEFAERRVRAIRHTTFIEEFLEGGVDPISSFLDYKLVSSPANPPATFIRIFADTDNSGHLTQRDSSGSEIDLAYLDADAIAAVEGEATLALSGAVEITGILTVDTINEKTGAAGVTVDGLLIKDGWPDPVVIKLLGEVFN
ncbi:hypothetical protein LCGC14_2478140 [marine sediment metagenome]|uniref:Uncharacterized protein n=1 Tax=marine sediment metagenome TaxID=412755 RepID=A0A0F9DKF0_9ZZZZ